MSFRKDKILSLLDQNLAALSDQELQKMFAEVLKSGMFGIGFSPYEEGQKPGDIITEKQIRRRMEILKPYTKWVRSFSCTDGNELIPKIAKEYGIKTLVGAWLGTDKSINEREINNVIQLAKDGYADMVAVGNEVMYRGDLTEDELVATIKKVKSEIPNIPVGYVDAYYEFEQRPNITENCDVIMANCYPFWEGCQIDYSLVYMKDMYHRALRAAKGKKVIISETGWPNIGQNFYGAQPSYENAIRYFINAQKWSKQEDIEMFYFSSFDESWKIGAEGDVGAYWGLWDKEEELKY
ncbi:MAG: glycoside hydrolase family 17 protein [Lutibacter sp.]